MRFYKLISSCFGIGYLKGGGSVAAATWLLFWIWLPSSYPIAIQFIVIALLMIAGTFFSSRVERVWGIDSSKVVIDEVLGMAVSLFAISQSWQSGFVAFVLFRFFDIVKPLGIRKMEQFKGGFGVMADDFVAGLYSNLLLHGLLLIAKNKSVF